MIARATGKNGTRSTRRVHQEPEPNSHYARAPPVRVVQKKRIRNGLKIIMLNHPHLWHSGRHYLSYAPINGGR